MQASLTYRQRLFFIFKSAHADGQECRLRLSLAHYITTPFPVITATTRNHESRSAAIIGNAHHALRKIQRQAAGRFAGSLPGLVRARRFSVGRTGQPDRTHVRTRPQCIEAFAGSFAPPLNTTRSSAFSPSRVPAACQTPPYQSGAALSLQPVHHSGCAKVRLSTAWPIHEPRTMQGTLHLPAAPVPSRR